MKIKTNELSGVDLDWAVAKCEVGEDISEIDDPHFYSTDWAIGGPIIDGEGISVIYYGTFGRNGPWEASRNGDTHYIDQYPGDGTAGPTALIAAMRCYVASKLGDEVDVPEELK